MRTDELLASRDSRSMADMLFVVCLPLVVSLDGRALHAASGYRSVQVWPGTHELAL